MSAAKHRAQVPAFTGCHCMRLRGVPLVRRSECGNVKMTPRFDTGRWCGGARLQCGRRGGRDWLYARTDRSQGHNRGINPLATWKCGRPMCGRRGGHPSPGKCRSPRAETPRLAVAVRTTRRSSLPRKVQGLRKRRRHGDCGGVPLACT